jgi:hypothetical protein
VKKIVIAALAAGLCSNAMAEELPIKRVVLSTAGLAQFTHSGEAGPGATIDLSVRLDQVDDLLKSLTIFDEQGAIGTVSLPGKSPLTELFRDLPFGPDALNSLPALLNALVGSEVEIEGKVGAKGRLLRVQEERVQLPDDGGQVTRHRITLMTGTGLVQAMLEELSAVRFTDPTAQSQIDRALAGLAQNRTKDRRTLAIRLLGKSARQVGFSYVVAAPVWKTAYRVVLPQKDGDKARFQGWGVVENLTGSDWKDIELSLISGNPVALKQPLYTAFYAERPEIPVTVAQRVVPRKDDADEAKPAPMEAAGSAERRMRQMAKPSAEPRGLAKGGGVGFAASAQDAVAMDGDGRMELGSAAAAAEAEEAATQIAYRFPEKITLANGSTVMVPFVDREISASRTWLYQPETNARHPLAAIRLKNDTETALPAGIITAFDRTGDGKANFVGDAQLPLTAKGASKFVTFALDPKTDVRRIDMGVKQVRLGKSVDGQLTLTTKSTRAIDFEITPPAEEDREVVIDEARADGWQPAGDTANIEQTAARLRYKVMAPKAQTTKASLKLERTDMETIRLSSLDTDAIYTTLQGLENTSPALKAAIAKLGAAVAAINKAEQRRSELETEKNGISEDQERIRKNLATVGQNSDLGRRYLGTLRTQEDRLDAIRDENKKLEAEIKTQRDEAIKIANALVL